MQLVWRVRRDEANAIETAETDAVRQRATAPAEAGVQLENWSCRSAARRYYRPPNWAPAFAGVVVLWFLVQRSHLFPRERGGPGSRVVFVV